MLSIFIVTLFSYQVGDEVNLIDQNKVFEICYGNDLDSDGDGEIKLADFNGDLDALGIENYKEVGMIAQEVKTIPELEFCVSEYEDPITNENMFSLNYHNIHNISLQAIQELSQKNNQLENKNTELENKVITLETQVANLLERVQALEDNN